MKDLDKIIMARRSVRSFDKHEQITEADVESLRKAIYNAKSPFYFFTAKSEDNLLPT